jgi:hypothetical protein
MISILPWTDDSSQLRENLRHEIWTGPGCVVVRGFPLDVLGPEKARSAYVATTELLGPVLPQTVSGVMMYSVRDEGIQLKRDYGRAGVRTSKTNAAFGFHTDSPSRLAGHTPDAIGLLVLQTAKSGGASVFVDGRGIYDAIAKERPDYLERLSRPFWVDRRAELPAGEDPILPVPVFSTSPQFRVRYLRLYIEKGQELAGEPLTVEDTEALDYFEAVAARLATTFQLERGDMQFLNNATHLHGRSAYEDHEDPALKRHYLRIWVERALST